MIKYHSVSLGVVQFGYKYLTCKQLQACGIFPLRKQYIKALPERQPCPVHPGKHVHLLGAVHTPFTPQPPLQIATRK